MGNPPPICPSLTTGTIGPTEIFDQRSTKGEEMYWFAFAFHYMTPAPLPLYGILSLWRTRPKTKKILFSAHLKSSVDFKENSILPSAPKTWRFSVRRGGGGTGGTKTRKSPSQKKNTSYEQGDVCLKFIYFPLRVRCFEIFFNMLTAKTTRQREVKM